MKKLLRKIFSSKILCFIFMFIEFAILVAFWSIVEFDFAEYAWPERTSLNLALTIIFYALRTIFYIIDIFVFFRIILRDENPEYKIPWLVVMFILPVWTLIFYLVFGSVKMRRGDVIFVEHATEILKRRQEENSEVVNKITDTIEPQYRGVFNYLSRTNHLDVSTGNRITYFKNGEEFFPDVIEWLKKAEKFILMEFFIIGEGTWWQKALEVLKERAANGVEVHLIYDDLGSSGVIPKKIIDTLQSFGIDCHVFRPVMPTMNNSVNNRDHRKIVVVDHKCAYTGGMNFADEYANDVVRFGYWKDSMVRIEGKGISNFIAIFLQNYQLSTFKIVDFDKYLNGDYPEFDDKGYYFGFGDAPGGYDDYEQIGEQNYINLLNAAEKEVYISTPYLIPSYPLMRALLGAVKRGVKIHLIVPGTPDKRIPYLMAKSTFRLLIDAGIDIYTYTPGFNHEKQMLVDDRLCFVGTVNFDFRSLTHHFECGITFLDAPCLAEIKADFVEMLAASQKVPADFRIKGLPRFVAAVMKIFRVLF